MIRPRLDNATLKESPLLVSLSLGAVSCTSQVSAPAATDTAILGAQAVSAVKAPSRLRAADGSRRVLSFATFYQMPDTATLTRLSKRDISFVQPNTSPNQMRALQTTGNAAAYLSIGKLGTSNTDYVNGQPVSGQSIHNQHVSDGWFVGKNGNFGSYLLDLTRAAVRDFVVSRGQLLLDRSFDGLFLDTADLDTADAAEFFNNGVTTQAFTSGALTLYAGRPDYQTVRRAYIDTVKALRVAVGSNLLIQNGGFDLLLDRHNESNKPASATDDLTWPTDPANYESWETYYARIGSTQAQQDRPYRDWHSSTQLSRSRHAAALHRRQPEQYLAQSQPRPGQPLSGGPGRRQTVSPRPPLRF